MGNTPSALKLLLMRDCFVFLHFWATELVYHFRTSMKIEK